MTYPHGPREGAPKTIRLEDQPLPDHEVSFYTPRAGDWLLLGVLVVALLGIGARVWAQLGWGDLVGQAIFFGLMLLAIYWTALIFTFKLSLSLRVGPQGLAIVRGPWRVELRWSEITRLMERPQTVGGRRYRWVVALARDGRRIQVREDALLDYERFRREVYERYRLWRDHGGTWGATGGGPFTAKESVADEARWWAFAGLMIALPGVYLALLLPGAQLAGFALLALALLCLGMVAWVFLQRRAYALDGRKIEAHGLLERIQLAWRDVSKVERTRHPASGVILALVAAGRLMLRLAARGDAGIRGFAWSPRVPEYLTLRGGGRHARIRLHHLNQPEELLAWIEFYTGLRRGGPSRPLEATDAAAPRRAGTSRPLETAASAATRRASAPSGPLAPAASAEEAQDERTPDLSGVSGPLDPWGGARRGEPAREPALETAPRGAPLGASFRERDGLDLPPDVAADAGEGTGQNDEAWLRETSALLSMNSGMNRGAPTRPTTSPAPAEGPRAAVDPVADAPTRATPAAPPQPPMPHGRQFVRPPFTPRAPTSAPPHTPSSRPSSAPPRATPPSAPPHAPSHPAPFAPHPMAQPRPESPFAPYNPDMPGETPLEGMMEAPTEAAPAMPFTPAARPPMPAPIIPPAPPERAPVSQPAHRDIDVSGNEYEDAEGEGSDEPILDEPAPWQKADWQPPVLPRFGPQNAQPGEDYPPRRDERQTDH